MIVNQSNILTLSLYENQKDKKVKTITSQKN